MINTTSLLARLVGNRRFPSRLSLLSSVLLLFLASSPALARATSVPPVANGDPRAANEFEQQGIAQLRAGTFPHEVQMEFERADRSEDATWLAENWDQWRKQMAVHALGSFGLQAFRWRFFQKWLRKNKDLKGAKKCLKKFKKHPAWVQVQLADSPERTSKGEL